MNECRKLTQYFFVGNLNRSQAKNSGAHVAPTAFAPSCLETWTDLVRRMAAHRGGLARSLVMEEFHQGLSHGRGKTAALTFDDPRVRVLSITSELMSHLTIIPNRVHQIHTTSNTIHTTHPYGFRYNAHGSVNRRTSPETDVTLQHTILHFA